MKTPHIAAIAGAALIGLIAWTSYNGLVGVDENVNVTAAQIQVQLRRQAQLLPNLAETVKGAAAFEKETYAAVAAARAQVTAAANIDPTKIAGDPELQKKVLEAQTAMQQAMVKLNAAREAYPDLKANKNFQDLFAEVAGSQNRVSVAMTRNQEAVRAYNGAIRVFPRVLFAKTFGFAPRPYYEASAADQDAPKLSFGK